MTKLIGSRIPSVVLLVLCAVAPSVRGQTAHEFNEQAVVFYNAGQWEEAVQSFERAYELAPDNAVVRRNLCNAHQAAANALAKEADFAAAVRHLELATSIDPENESPLIQLGSYYLRLDYVAEAIARLEQAIELAPRSVDAHDLLGDAYYMDNDVPSAQVQWKWVLEVQLNRPGLREKIEKASREAAVEASFRPSGSRHFQLTYSPDIPGRMLRRVTNCLERAYIDVGRDLGGTYAPTPIQVIVYNAKEFTDATQAGQHIGALYDGKIRIPLYDPSGNALSDEELKQRLYHEFTHVVVRFLAGNRVPWWLNEGLAETFSKPLGSNEMGLLQTAQEEKGLFTLQELSDSQLKKLEPVVLRLAYAQAHATVHYLWTRFGQHRLVNLMSDIAQGIDPEEAVRRNYNRSYAGLEKEVRRTFASE